MSDFKEMKVEIVGDHIVIHRTRHNGKKASDITYSLSQAKFHLERWEAAEYRKNEQWVHDFRAAVNQLSGE